MTPDPHHPQFNPGELVTLAGMLLSLLALWTYLHANIRVVTLLH